MLVVTRHSVYEIDLTRKTWARIARSVDSGPLKVEDGDFWEISGVSVGRNMVMICPPVNDNSIARMVRTSTVMLVKEAV